MKKHSLVKYFKLQMEKRSFTGFRDCIGRPIFEGDIIYDLHYVGRGKRKHYYEVVYQDGKPGMLKICDRSNFTPFDIFTFSSEYVIGNIFDNPELLR